MSTANPVVELWFPFSATLLPADSGYSMYSALASQIPEIHGAEWIGIHSVRGRLVEPGTIKIGRSERLRIRLPLEKTPLAYKLAGAKLQIAGHTAKLGIPEMRMLSPSHTLRSRIVLIKPAHLNANSLEPESYLDLVKRKVDELGIAAPSVELEREYLRTDQGPYARRILRVKSATLVGYGVVLRGLTAEDSIKVQERGIGGKRSMGCGLFVPLGELD